MKVRQHIAVFLALTIAVLAEGTAQEAMPKFCASSSDPASAAAILDTGGIYMTARGTVRALVVFASFFDDATPHPYWPQHQPPQFMQEFIDPDTNTRSTSPFNLTNYFRQMSLGQFNLIGEAIWIESTHSQEEYREGAYGRANRHLLQEQADPIVDFTQYDGWTRVANHQHLNAPDGIVDMIIMVWRTNMFEYLGEASLGYNWGGFTVDGIRIETGYPAYLPYPQGSGVTVQYIYTDTPYKVMQTMVHEVGHWLLGKMHPYNGDLLSGKHAYWGILCSNQRVASCANAYERERLGWITVPEIPPDQTVVLADFLTTGAAFKHRPQNGEPFEYFYLENHQLLSPFDDVTLNTSDRGTWVLHQQSTYSEMDNLKIKPSDGSWRWGNPSSTTQCFSRLLPVFRQETPFPSGLSHRDQIPNATSSTNWLHALNDSNGQLQCGYFSAGEYFSGSFNRRNPVFSPFSNPNSNTWERQPTSFSFEIVGDSGGTITLRHNANPLDGPPARRYLGIDPAAQGIPPGSIALAWGSQWPEGQLIEPDVNWSHLERQIGPSGNWITAYQGSDMNWIDTSIPYDTSGTVPVFFRVRVRDVQGKHSVWSNTFRAATTASGIEELMAGSNLLPSENTLRPNYPNPFNSSTVIAYAIPVASTVRISVSDILGREIRELAKTTLAAGIYTAYWDGKNESGAALASGIYLCRMDTRPREHTQNKSTSRFIKMLLIK